MNRLLVDGPWGGGNMMAAAFHKFAPMFDVELVNHPLSADVIFLMGLDPGDTGCGFEQAIKYRSMTNKSIKVVARINENDARKGTIGVDNLIVQVLRNVDGAVFVSNWLKEYFRPRPPFTLRTAGGGVFPWFGATDDEARIFEDYPVVINGVDRSVFFPRQLKKHSEKVRLVTAHWSDNSLKGQDVTEFIDDFVGRHTEFEYDYIGRTKAKLRNSHLINPLHGSYLGEALSAHDVCINGTRFDPGPNSVIESISCGLPTYVYKDGGGAVEFAGNGHIFNSLEELETVLLNKKFQINTTTFNDWSVSICSYAEYIKSVVLLSS